MKLRLALAAATCLALPLAAHAQAVSGPYVGLEGGVTLLNSVNYTASLQDSSGNAKYNTGYAGAAELGYGLGNGFRVELDVDDLHNTLNKTTDSVYGSARTSGKHSVYGPMANVEYDIMAGLPVIPYVGAGLGYQWVFANSRDTMAYSENKGSLAYDAIAGLSYPINAAPGLAVTAEYRFQETVGHPKATETVYGAGTTGTLKFGQSINNTFMIGLRYALFTAPMAAPAAAPMPAAMPMATPAPAPARTFLVFFDWDKANLTPRATQIIAEAASDSKTQNVTTLDVSGYTDTSGTPDYNMGLSERRAKAVAGQLVADGVAASEIEIHAFGETHLLVQTGPGVREPQNRRVEIVLK